MRAALLCGAALTAVLCDHMHVDRLVPAAPTVQSGHITDRTGVDRPARVPVLYLCGTLRRGGPPAGLHQVAVWIGVLTESSYRGYSCSVSLQVKAAEEQGGQLRPVLEHLPPDPFHKDIHTTEARGWLGVGFPDALLVFLLLLVGSVFSTAKPCGRQGQERGDERSEDEETSLQHHFGSSFVFLCQFSADICFILLRQ